MAQISTYNVTQTVTATALAASVAIDADEFKDERTVLVFNITTTDAGATITIGAGGYSEASQGSITVPVTVGIHVVCLESARFKATDGDIDITIDSIGTLAGTVLPLQLP